jgi:hypothetical protein
MPILLAGTTEFFHVEQVSALFKFRLGQVLLYFYTSCLSSEPDVTTFITFHMLSIIRCHIWFPNRTFVWTRVFRVHLSSHSFPLHEKRNVRTASNLKNILSVSERKPHFPHFVHFLSFKNLFPWWHYYSRYHEIISQMWQSLPPVEADAISWRWIC